MQSARHPHHVTHALTQLMIAIWNCAAHSQQTRLRGYGSPPSRTTMLAALTSHTEPNAITCGMVAARPRGCTGGSPGTATDKRLPPRRRPPLWLRDPGTWPARNSLNATRSPPRGPDNGRRMLDPEASDLSTPGPACRYDRGIGRGLPVPQPAQHDARKGDDRRFPAQLAETFVPQGDNASRLRAHAGCPPSEVSGRPSETRRSSLTRQIDLIGAPQLMSIGAILAAQHGGYGSWAGDRHLPRSVTGRIAQPSDLIAESGCPVFALTSRVVVRRSADYGVLFLLLRWTLLRCPGLRVCRRLTGRAVRGTHDHEAGGVATAMSGLSARIATSGPWARKRSRSTNFCTLPEGVRGNCSTTVQ